MSAAFTSASQSAPRIVKSTGEPPPLVPKPRCDGSWTEPALRPGILQVLPEREHELLRGQLFARQAPSA